MRARATAAALAGLALLTVVAGAHAEANGARAAGPAGASSTPVTLPLDGKWYYSATNYGTTHPDSTHGWMNIPDQDTLWKVTSQGGATLSITDSWTTGDRFEVYVDGAKVLTTPAVASHQLPEIEPDVPSDDPPKAFTEQQKVTDSFEAARYTSGTVEIGAGEHTVNVRSLVYPSGLGGAGLALRAVPKSPSALAPTSWGAIKHSYR